MKKAALFLSAAVFLPFFAFAENSAPSAVSIIDTIPAARDVAFNGTIQLKVDATNTDQAIFNVEEIIPVQRAGHMVLLYPKWLPGKHGPRGAIEKLAGLKITANGQEIPWVRDAVDVFAFHINVPAGVREIKANFQYLSPTTGNQGRIEMTSVMSSIEWNNFSLYPAGYYTRRIPISASVKLPAGWSIATALRPSSTNGDTTIFHTVDYDTLVDSPAIAGQHFRKVQLTDKVALNIVADDPKYLEASQEQIDAHKRLVEQAVKTFGAEHYDHYDFLFSLSDELGGIGLEHHRSSENGLEARYFTDWEKMVSGRYLLPHEFTHSWDGKFRRGADAWTPDFRTPMQNSLLWVYEGQTQFWGYVLAARSGLFTKEQTMEALAMIAAELDARKGRNWRPLVDTTNDPIITARAPKAWVSYQRSEDYYNEGMMVWIETDAKLRELSHGQKGMDDFARAFFGIKDGDWGVVTYRLEDVAATLNAIAPYDWRGFLQSRLDDTGQRTVLNGFAQSGYSLTFTDEPNDYLKDVEGRQKFMNLSYSLGMNVNNDGTVASVLWDGVAFNNRLAVGDKIIAVNGKSYEKEALLDAVKNSKNVTTPLQLIVQSDNRIRTISLDYHGGARYPHFEKTGTGEGAIDILLKELP